MAAKYVLRFAERGGVRWVEFVSESHPARPARHVVIGDRRVDDFGRQFRTTALSSAPRILYVEEGDTDGANPGADLPAFRDRVLDRLDDVLADRTPRPLRLAQPLPHLLAIRSHFRAFIDMPLPSRLAPIGEARVCAVCSRRTDTTVESLNQGWGCLDMEGRTYWLCSTCYGDAMAQQPESPHAAAWRRRQARHQQRLRLVAALTSLDDIKAVRQGDAEALTRLTDRLAARWKPALDHHVLEALLQRRRVENETSGEAKRRAVAVGILLTPTTERQPQRIRFDDGTMLRDEEHRTTLIQPGTLVLPLYDWWFSKESLRLAAVELVGDAPELARDADTLPDALRQEDVATDLAETLDRDAELMLAPFSSEERRLIRRAVADGSSLADAARALQKSAGSAKTYIARIREKADRLFPRDRRNRQKST